MAKVASPTYRAEVGPEWVDYNGHLNEAHYLLIFSRATDALLDAGRRGGRARRRARWGRPHRPPPRGLLPSPLPPRGGRAPRRRRDRRRLPAPGAGVGVHA